MALYNGSTFGSDGEQSLLLSQQFWCKLLKRCSATTRVMLDMFTIINPPRLRNTITYNFFYFFWSSRFSPLYSIFHFFSSLNSFTFFFPPLQILSCCHQIGKMCHEANSKRNCSSFWNSRMVCPFITNESDGEVMKEEVRISQQYLISRDSKTWSKLHLGGLVLCQLFASWL